MFTPPPRSTLEAIVRSGDRLVMFLYMLFDSAYNVLVSILVYEKSRILASLWFQNMKHACQQKMRTCCEKPKPHFNKFSSFVLRPRGV